MVGVYDQEPIARICPASPSPAVYPMFDPSQPIPATNSPTVGFPKGSPLAGAPVPAGSYFIPFVAPATPRANPAIANTWTWFSRGDSSYHALQVDLRRRFSRGLSLRGVYTWSKTLDDGDSVNQTTPPNTPALLSNPSNLPTANR